MKMTKFISMIVATLLLSLFLSQSVLAAETPRPQKMVQINETIDYPDHIQIHSSYQTHIITTEAFLETHKDLKLVKQTNNALYVKKMVNEESPISSIIVFMGINGKEALQVEKASLNPMERIKSFIQLEMGAYKT